MHGSEWWETVKSVLVAVGVVLLAGCAPPDTPGSEGTPGRPADGLLSNETLRHLVDLQTERNTAELVGHLEVDDPLVRARAAYALGSVQDTTAVEELLPLLHDLDARVRADAAFAVGQLPMSGLAMPLFDALKVEWDRAAQLAQLDAIGKRCEEGTAGRLFQLEDPELRWAVDKAMASCVLAGVREEEIWPRLAADLFHADARVREWAAYPFGRSPDPGRWRRHARELRRALREYQADDVAAMHLIRALGRLRDQFSADILGWWLRNGTTWQARANAAEALGGYELGRPRRYLLDALDDPSVHVRLQVVSGLAGSPPAPETVARLEGWLTENPDDVPTAAPILQLLAQVGESDVIEAWFDRSDITEERVLLAGIGAAAALVGERGVELLVDAVRIGTPRASRSAVRELVARWEGSRLYEEARGVFYEVFSALGSHEDAVVGRMVGDALQDTLFTPFGGGPAGDAADAEEDTGRSAGSDRVRSFRAVDWDHLRALGAAPRLHILTNLGEVVLELRTEEAPLTVDAIASVADDGRFDGVPFHRVVPNFVVQGGDVTRSGTLDRVGWTLRSEFTRTPYLAGVLGMASSGKDTESTQYFVTHSPQPHLDGGYTAFGTVIEGREVLDALGPEDWVERAWVTPSGPSRTNRH